MSLESTSSPESPLMLGTSVKVSLFEARPPQIFEETEEDTWSLFPTWPRLHNLLTDPETVGATAKRATPGKEQAAGNRVKVKAPDHRAQEEARNNDMQEVTEAAAPGKMEATASETDAQQPQRVARLDTREHATVETPQPAAPRRRGRGKEGAAKSKGGRFPCAGGGGGSRGKRGIAERFSVHP